MRRGRISSVRFVFHKTKHLPPVLHKKIEKLSDTDEVILLSGQSGRSFCSVLSTCNAAYSQFEQLSSI